MTLFHIEQTPKRQTSTLTLMFNNEINFLELTYRIEVQLYFNLSVVKLIKFLEKGLLLLGKNCKQKMCTKITKEIKCQITDLHYESSEIPQFQFQ